MEHTFKLAGDNEVHSSEQIIWSSLLTYQCSNKSSFHSDTNSHLNMFIPWVNGTKSSNVLTPFQKN